MSTAPARKFVTTPSSVDTEKYGAANFEMVSPDTLKPHPRNPPQRTNPKSDSYKKLRQSIIEAGGVLQPLHVSSDGVVEDGNTRRSIAVELRIPVPVLRYERKHTELEGQGLYDDLNRTGKGFKPKDQFVYALQGGNVGNKSIMSLAKFTRELLTPQEFEVFMKSKPSPSLVEYGKQAARFCLERGDQLGEKATQTFIRKAILWMIRWKQQRPLHVYMQLKRSHNKAKTCIENSRPLPTLG